MEAAKIMKDVSSRRRQLKTATSFEPRATSYVFLLAARGSKLVVNNSGSTELKQILFFIWLECYFIALQTAVQIAHVYLRRS